MEQRFPPNGRRILKGPPGWGSRKLGYDHDYPGADATPLSQISRAAPQQGRFGATKTRRDEMNEIGPDILHQLELAQAEIDQGTLAVGPPVATETSISVSSQTVFGAAGSGTAKHVLLDHYMSGSVRRLWTFVDNAWRYQNITNVEEQGVAQVAFAASRVDAWWNTNNQMSLLRCWKIF